MSMHHAAAPDEEPGRPELAPRAKRRHATVAAEHRPPNDGVPWFRRLVVGIAESRNLVITVKFDDRVISYSASGRGETQR
jgi:hypothetical protein